MKVVVVIIVVIGLSALFKYTSGFGITELASYLSTIGVAISGEKIITSFIIGLALVTVLLLVISYFAIGRKKYTVSEDALIADRGTVKFDNIARVNYDNSGLSDKLLGKGTITFELTGVDQQKVDLDFVDQPATVTEQIQQVINNYRMKKYARYADQQRIDKIIESF